jgi:NADP-dependent 3-hydroxy acid dehydrogenase YdfG
MYMLKDKVVAITGAGSGIGRALAQELDRKGCRLALTDINEQGLAETAATLSKAPHTQKLDVARRDDVYAWAETVKREFGTAHVVINNAGVAVAQTIDQLSYEDFEWLMDINFWGVVYGTKAFLPTLLAQREGVVVNLSSLFGLVAVPANGAYNAAKFAVRGFTEALRHELKDSGVTAICVHPGGIKTNIAANSRFYVGPDGTTDHKASADRFQRIAATTPQQAARTIIRAIETGQERLLIGADAKLISFLQRLMPAGYWHVMSAIMQRAG